MSVAFFLPAFISPFMPNVLSKFVLAIDIIFSYLYVVLLTSFTNPTGQFKTNANNSSDRWLTAFIFSAQDYNWRDCATHAPPGRGGCSKKHANEAFIFLAL